MAVAGRARRFVVLTGGEPLLQVDDTLIERCTSAASIGIETNGTIAPPPGIDWVCVSPKADTACRPLGRRVEAGLAAGKRTRCVMPISISPLLGAADGRPDRARRTALAIAYCLAHPRWQLSLQTHKTLGIR